MTNAFSRASAVLFANQDRAVSATYKVAATGQVKDGVRLLRAQPTKVVGILGQDIASGTTTFHAQLGDVPDAGEGDLIVTEAGSFTVQGQPRKDDLGIWWILDTVPS